MAPMEDEAYTKHMKAGLTAMLASDAAAAEKAYRAAIAQNAKLPCAYRELTSLLRDQSRFHDAESIGKQMISQKPLTTSDYLKWSSVAAELGELDKSATWLAHFVKSDPAKANSTFAEAVLLERKGELDEAAKRYDELFQLGRYRNVRRQLATVRIKQRQLPEAEELLAEHVLRNPFDQYSRLMLSIARGLSGKDDQAALLAYLKDMNCSDKTWSKWLLAYQAGEVTKDILLKQANAMGTKAERVGQVCEAYFSIGIQAVIKKDLKTARTFLKKTMDMGITMYIEHYWARDELKLLDEK
jgi:predicted Zn-dependent protease